MTIQEFSLLASIILALIGFMVHKTTEKKKATISSMERLMSDAKIAEAKKVLYQINADFNVDIKKYGIKNITGEDETVRDSILSLINHYEQLSVGVNARIYDINIIHNLMGGSIIKGWKYTEPMILEMRKSFEQPTAYKNFQQLANTLEEKSGK